MSALIIIVIIVLGVALYDYFDAKDWQHITCVDRINTVFEERNKKYGAYSIRRDYNDLVLFIVLGLFGLFMVLTIVNTSLSPSREELVLPIVKMDTTLLTLPEPPEDNIKTVKTPYKIVGGGGSGTPDNSKYDPKPKPMMKQPNELSTSNQTSKPAKGNSNSGKNPNEESSTREKSPFSGSGGKGGGDGKGKGKGLGDDDGNGKGFGPDGDGSGTPVRIVVNAPNLTGIPSDEACKVCLQITIAPDGSIVGTPKNSPSCSTTTNAGLIEEVIRRVKAGLRFNKIDGTYTEKVTKTFSVKPN